ncbi:MAG: YmdB family metallophosphoesterase, partial [Sneathiella sp.]|nr:YmdB family metallophosphoesterase [Sneathiella sp.]
DGRVTAVIGTHQHVPTADAMILPKGTGYQTDAGMCGDYHSVIGMDIEEPVRRFVKKIPGGRFSPALGAGSLCAVLIESDDKTGLAKSIRPIRVGGHISQTEVEGA